MDHGDSKCKDRIAKELKKTSQRWRPKRMTVSLSVIRFA